jgi:uroporphyrinogen decarboxylase
MTSRQRVLRAIRHEEADRIPLDLGSTYVTGIHAYSYGRLREHMGLSGSPVEIIDTYQLLARVEDEVLDRFGIDVLPLFGAYDPLGVKCGVGLKEWVMPNGEPSLVSKDFFPELQEDGSYLLEKGGNLFRLPCEGFYFDAVRPVLAEAGSMDDIERLFNFSGFTQEQADYYRKEAECLRGSERAIVGEIFATFEIEFYFGYEQGMMNLLTNKQMMIDFLDRLTGMYMKNFDLFRDAVGKGVDVITVYKDLGNQNGPSVNPAVVREVFMPPMKRFVRHVKEHSDYAVMLHACGSIYDFIPDIIDCGFDILNPVQISARNMAPDRLKGEFGDRLCFWGGGVDTQATLPFGSTDEVRSQVRQNAETLCHGGGFVFNPVHNIQAGVPPESIVAAYDEASEMACEQ